MNPLLFGASNAPLYGVHHQPSTVARSTGVVLCNPFGQEYMRAHRALRQLSLLLCRHGFHVLRFDYRGTGDSSGTIEDATPEAWVEDVGHAVEELKDLSGVASITLVGLRLGAALATLAREGRSDVGQLVLWDPVVSGRDYIDELRREIVNEPPNHYGPPSGNREWPDGALHYNGFVLPAALRTRLLTVQLDERPPASAGRILQLVSHETPAFSRLRDAWRTHPAFRYQFTPAPHDWNFVDNFGGILLPQPSIQAIVSWLVAQES